MSKPRPKQPKDVTPFWVDRGFKPEIASMPPDPNEDPKGEVAYQREFYKAAQLKPPRVPNPSSFPNSPSAREYIRRMNSAADGRPRLDRRLTDTNNDTSPTTKREWGSDGIPEVLSRKSTSTSPASNYSTTAATRPSLPTVLSTPRGEERRGSIFGDQRQLPPLPSMAPGNGPVNRPAFLETGARGPSNTLRPFF